MFTMSILYWDKEELAVSKTGECSHLYPRCVHDAFSDYQLPEHLRTPLQSLCLQIKSLQLGCISEFLSKALQSPESLSVANAIEYLKKIGALEENESLTVLGSKLAMIPVEPKLGKMLIDGAILNCLDPLMTIALVRALSTKLNSAPEEASRPFDCDRDGFTIGEGAGVLVLEELEHGRNRGAKVYAELHGYGCWRCRNHHPKVDAAQSG